MAQLKDLLVSGPSRLIGKLFANEVQLTTLNIPTASNGTTYGPGTSGQALVTNGTSAYWKTITIADIGGSDVLGVAKGGTGNTVATQGGIVYGNGTTYALTAAGSANQYLKSNGTSAPTWQSALNLTAAGALGWNSGGATHADNLRLVNVNAIAYWNGAYSGTNSNLKILGTVTTGTWNATKIAVGYGGTNATSVNNYGIVYGNSDGTAYASTVAGTSGYLLQSGGGSAAPSWIQATNANTASTIVKRDSSGNFSAGTITATLSGNASSATKLGSANVGSSTQPIYLEGGTPKAATAYSGLFTALSWTAGTTSGPTISITVGGTNKTSTIPSAGSAASGVITTGSQTFAGNKTFNSDTTEIRSDVIRFRNKSNNNTQAGTNPYVTSLLIGDGREVTIDEYGDGYLGIHSKYGIFLQSNSNPISVYNETATYAVGNLVWYDRKYYRCTTAISTAEAWTAGHWTQIPAASGTIVIDGNVQPITTDTKNLGTSDYKWKNVYATTFNGALSGNATSATKANLTTSKYGVAYYSDTAGTFASTIAGTANYVLKSGGGTAAPSWMAQSDITAGYASKLTALTTGDAASSTATERYVWISYNDNSTGRPAYTTALTFQTSTGTLKATKFSGDGSGLTNLTAANISAGTLPIARGGTNATSVNAYGVVYGNSGGTAYASTVAGTSGYLLQSGGGTGAPSWIAQSDIVAGKATADGSGNTITTTYVKKAGDTMTGDLSLQPSSSSSNDSPDIVWKYGDGTEKMRIWSPDSPTAKQGPNFRIYKSDGTSLYSGTLVPADGTGASGTWGISISGNAATATTASSAAKLTTARNLGVALGSTTAVTFDGSGNQTSIPISGTLAIGHGGTGATTAEQARNNLGCGTAATYNIDDATSNGALGTGTGLTTERSVYYGLVTVNGASQTRATGIYAPTEAGIQGCILISMGSGAPGWTLQEYLDVGAASKLHLGTSSAKCYVCSTPDSTISDPTHQIVYNTNIYTQSNVLYGAAWNDYAEYRETEIEIEPGRVVVENGDDTLSLSTERMQPGAEIVSDTFGFAIGETEKSKTPIAASGRVLAYPHEPRRTYKPGQPVCSGPNGTVSQMTDEEARTYPWLIIGTVSAVPEYETWGEGKVKVNGRIWIRIR